MFDKAGGGVKGEGWKVQVVFSSQLFVSRATEENCKWRIIDKIPERCHVQKVEWGGKDAGSQSTVSKMDIPLEIISSWKRGKDWGCH